MSNRSAGKVTIIAGKIYIWLLNENNRLTLHLIRDDEGTDG